MQKDSLGTTLQNGVNVLLAEFGLAVNNHIVTLDGYNLTGILINKVLHPSRKNTSSQFAADVLLQVGAVDLHLVSQVEDFQNLLVGLESDGTQQGGNGLFLLSVDVGIHHVVDVGSELDPRTLEGDDTCRVELRTIGVHTLTEEYTG